jgi:hypothetical protein
MYVRLKAFWNAAFDLVMADDAGVVEVVLKKLFDLTGELWKNRMAGDDLVMGLRPAETAKGLRRTKAMSAERVDVGRCRVDKSSMKVGRERSEVVEARETSITSYEYSSVYGIT